MPARPKENTPQVKKTPKRVIFVNRFYAPDLSATSQILTDVAETLAISGNQVWVFASRTTYEGDRIQTKAELLNNVSVHRVWSTRFGRALTI